MLRGHWTLYLHLHYIYDSKGAGLDVGLLSWLMHGGCTVLRYQLGNGIWYLGMSQVAPSFDALGLRMVSGILA